jgi:hypothetical protein
MFKVGAVGIGGFALCATLVIASSAQTAGGNAGNANRALIATGQEKGWTSLFDGKSMEGWEVIAGPGQDTKWEVKDGMLCGSGEASMLVCTKGPYKNFRFKAELMINDKGNSGMYFRCTRKPGFTDGYEAQVNATHSDPIKTGSLYTMVHLYKAAHKPDEIFTQEVECKDVNYRGKTVTAVKISVNGEVLYETLDHNNMFKEGYFAFQQHDPGSKVCIKSVEVMPLGEGSAK